METKAQCSRSDGGGEMRLVPFLKHFSTSCCISLTFLLSHCFCSPLIILFSLSFFLIIFSFPFCSVTSSPSLLSLCLCSSFLSVFLGFPSFCLCLVKRRSEKLLGLWEKRGERVRGMVTEREKVWERKKGGWGKVRRRDEKKLEEKCWGEGKKEGEGKLGSKREKQMEREVGWKTSNVKKNQHLNAEWKCWIGDTKMGRHDNSWHWCKKRFKYRNVTRSKSELVPSHHQAAWMPIMRLFHLFF